MMEELFGGIITEIVSVAVGGVVGSWLMRLAKNRKMRELEARLNVHQEHISLLMGLMPRSELPPLKKVTTPDGLPPKGWMRLPEAIRLAHEYVLAVPGIRRRRAAELVIEEFMERQPAHYDSDRRHIERIPLEAWLLTHRLPLPERWLWRGLTPEIGLDEHGEMMAFDPTKPAPPDLGKGRV